MGATHPSVHGKNVNGRSPPTLSTNEAPRQPAQPLLSPTPMGRPLRRQVPGQYYLVTVRCHQARFFLRPDTNLNLAVLEWLTRAQCQFPELRILAACVMSNHLHLVVHDQAGQLAAWASYFLGNLAKAVNRLRERSGACFERRYSAEPILDDEALVDRLVYTVTNPVKAGLCSRTDQWPGVVLFARGSRREGIPVSWTDRDQERRERARARFRGETPPGSETFRVESSLAIDPLLTEMGGSGDARLTVAVEAQEAELTAERLKAGIRPLGSARILAQSWHAAPRHPKRAPRPLCHAANPALRAAFREAFRAFVSLFREASERLSEGVSIPFPEWSFPPGRPLVRPAMADSA
jgi:REP element-mobilizing transposase RayT